MEETSDEAQILAVAKTVVQFKRWLQFTRGGNLGTGALKLLYSPLIPAEFHAQICF
jgi:hypothetical protein